MTRLQKAKECYDAAMDRAREGHRAAVEAARAAYQNASADAWEAYMEASGITENDTIYPLAREVHEQIKRQASR